MKLKYYISNKLLIILSIFLIFTLFFIIPVSASTGGTITSNDTHTTHKFTANGTFTPDFSGNITVLVVAGGGGGGASRGSGGGAGGIIYNVTYPVSSGTPINVTIGSGGFGGVVNTGNGSKGQNSSFGSLSADGGGAGKGGSGSHVGGSGGSGGGGTAITASGGTATSGQGYNGGIGGNDTDLPTNTGYPAGGGGGAGGAGQAGNNNNAGNGGTGTSVYSAILTLAEAGIDISGTRWIGGGGGGSYYQNGNYRGTGGNGGGGNGGNYGMVGSAGINNTGGGGGGGQVTGTPVHYAGGNGGSGIIIVFYESTEINFSDITNSGVLTNISPGDTISYGIVTDSVSNITWDIDGVVVQTNSSVTTANFTYTFNQSGHKKVNATATNGTSYGLYTWNNYIHFEIPVDYIWTPIQDWAFSNLTNIKLDVKPLSKLRYNLINGTAAQIWVAPQQFQDAQGNIQLVIANATTGYNGLYLFNVSSDGLTIDYNNRTYINGTDPSTGNAQAIIISKHNGTYYLSYQFLDGVDYKGYVTSGSTLYDLHEREYFPGHTDGVPWNIPVSGQGNYPNTGWQGIGGFFWNDTGIIGYGQADSGSICVRRSRVIAYEFFNSTNMSDNASTGKTWLPTGWGAETGAPLFMVNDTETTSNGVGQPCVDNSDPEHEYHGIGIIRVPYEKGYYGAVQILYSAAAPQGIYTTLWRTDSLENITRTVSPVATSGYGWGTVGTGSYDTITSLLPNGASGTNDDVLAVGSFSPGHNGMVSMFNGSMWYYYYNTGAGAGTWDDFSSVSLATSDAHKWSLAKLDGTNTTGSFITDTINKNSADGWLKFYANDNEGLGNITYSVIYPDNGTVIASDIQIGSNISLLVSNSINAIKLNISIIRSNSSITSPEVYNWYMVSSDQTPPASITNPIITYDGATMTDSWTDPTDVDFDHVYLAYRNGTFIANVDKEDQHIDLPNQSIADVSAQTVDTSGNMNETKVWFIHDTTAPLNVSNVNFTIGNFYINNTWTNPVDADFNGTIWKYENGTAVTANQSNTTTSLNLTWSPHYVQNISAQTVDISGNINATKVWFNATIANNAPVQAPISYSATVIAGDWLNFTVLTTDVDSDEITYATNSTNASSLIGNNFNWSTTSGDVGTYYWNFNSSDAYGGQDNETIMVTVSPIIDTSFTVTLPIGQTQAFFNATNKSSKDVNATGQNTTTGFIQITNTGNINLDFNINITLSPPTGAVLKANINNNSFIATEINQTTTQIINNLSASGSQFIWLWVDYSNALPMNTQKELSVNSSQHI